MKSDSIANGNTATSTLLPIELCQQHKHIDYQWSDGQAERCLDCGAIKDALIDACWDDIVGTLAMYKLIEEKNVYLPELMVQHRDYLRKYAELAENQSDIGYIAATDREFARLKLLKDEKGLGGNK